MIISIKRKTAAAVIMLAVIGISAGIMLRFGALNTLSREDGIPLVTIMYHGFLKNTAACGKYTVTPDTFENDILYLKENGYTFVDCRDIASYVSGAGELPEKPAMITIDDGYYNNYTYIYPILKKYGAKAVISPIACESDRYSESMDLNPAYANMCWDNIREMSDSGLVDIENHSYNLHKLSGKAKGCSKASGESKKDYTDRIYKDLKKADDAIFAATGKRPVCMTYPFGMTNKEARSVIDSLGYKVSLSCTEGVSLITRSENSSHMIKRYNRPYGISTAKFFSKILDEREKSE